MDSKGRNSMSVALVALLAAWTVLSHVPAASAVIGPVTITLYLQTNILSIFPGGADFIILPSLFGPLNSFYGGLVVFDGSVTQTASSTSPEIGRARGSFLGAAKDTLGPGLEETFTVQFNALTGNNGSTITFVGFERTTDTTRFLSIVGGTGTFVKASGQAVVTSSTVGFNVTRTIIATFTYGF